MAQATDFTIANQSFPSFRSDLNTVLSAINTMNSGTSRPSSAVAGTMWLDTTSASSPTIKFFDGSDDISFATIDYSANTVNFLDSTVVADLVGDTSPQLGGNLDVNGNDIVSTSNADIDIIPNGTGDVNLGADTVQIGDNNANATLTTQGTGDLILNTNNGTNAGNITLEDGANGHIQVTTNGTDFNTTLTSTYFIADHDEADSSTTLSYVNSDDQAQGTSFQRINESTGADNDESISGMLHLFDPSNTTFVKHYIAESSSAFEKETHTFTAGYFNTTSAVTGVQFKFGSGNIDSGVIKLYGVS